MIFSSQLFLPMTPMIISKSLHSSFLLFIPIRQPTTVRKHKPSEMLILSTFHHHIYKHMCLRVSWFFFSSFHNGAGWPLHLLCWISLLPPFQEPVLLVISLPYIQAASHWLLHIRHQTDSGLNQTLLKSSPFTAYVSPTPFLKRLLIP